MKKLIFIVFCCFFAVGNPAWSDPLNESLIYHVYFGKAQDVKRLLGKGANANSVDEHQWPALAIASDRSDAEAYPIAEALLAAGANPDNAFQNHYPITNAIHNNNSPLVAALIARDVNLGVSDAKGRTVPHIAMEAKDPQIFYYVSKRIHEEKQLQTYLHSSIHLRQILEHFAYNNCAFQYWAFYLKSKQDKNVDEVKLRAVIENHARIAQDAGTRAARYFPAIYNAHFNRITGISRDTVYKQLNSMISNRNRRLQGIGKESDMKKRCDAITAKVKEFPH